MSDAENAKPKGGWTDKERLTYLFALIDNSAVKFDYNTTPRPEGRSVIACQRMVDRLKGTLKNELEALKTGVAVQEGAPKKAASTPRKRKVSGDGENGEATPSKRGRKKKADVAMDVEVKAQGDDDDEMFKIKSEVQDGDLDAEEKV